MSGTRLGVSIGVLVLVAAGSTGLAARWERRAALSWLTLPTLEPRPPTPPVSPGGPGSIDSEGAWTAERLGPWEVKFPGEPAPVRLNLDAGARGVRSERPFEGYAAVTNRDWAAGRRGAAAAVAARVLDDFAALEGFGPAASERRGESRVERTYRSRHGEVAAAVFARDGETLLLVAVGPRSREFLDSARDTRPPAARPEPPCDPASVPGLVAHWPLDRVEGAALPEAVAGNTAIVPRGYAVEPGPPGRPAVRLRPGPAFAFPPPVQLDFPRPLRPDRLTICFWCQPRESRGYAVSVRGDGGGWGFGLPVEVARRPWSFVALRESPVDGRRYARIDDGRELVVGLAASPGGAYVGLDWDPDRNPVSGVSVYDRALSDGELDRLAGARGDGDRLNAWPAPGRARPRRRRRASGRCRQTASTRAARRRSALWR